MLTRAIPAVLTPRRGLTRPASKAIAQFGQPLSLVEIPIRRFAAQRLLRYPHHSPLVLIPVVAPVEAGYHVA